MALKKNIQAVALVLLALLGLSACKAVKDDLTDCPQGVDLYFFAQTPCQQNPTFPETITQAKVYLFDIEDVLVKTIDVNDLRMAQDSLRRYNMQEIGQMSFVAWASSNLSAYTMPAAKTGVTKKADLALQLPVSNNTVTGALTRLYYADSAVTLEDHSTEGTHYEQVDMNLQEVTNRINFNLTVTKNVPDDLNVSFKIVDKNDRYDYVSNIIGEQMFTYMPYDLESKVPKYTFHFDLMKLVEDGNAQFVVTDDNKNMEVLSINLVKDLLLKKDASGQTPFKLECDHDFDIKMEVERNIQDNTYVVVSATVNGWNVVSRDINPG